MSLQARGCLIMWSMKHLLLTALLSLLYFLPARAQIVFSDSLRIGLLTCSSGPDAYERFGHAALRIQDLRNPRMDVTFHYGVFSFHTPHFIYRFVKGETDYQLGALYTSDFVAEYQERGLGMTEQWLLLDSTQSQSLVEHLLINYRPENRTYRYSYFFDNCSTRPYHLINAAAKGQIAYDTAWVQPITLRDMVHSCTGKNNWLHLGIALAVAGRADQPTTFQEQLFLPDYLSMALAHATITSEAGSQPLVCQTDTLLTMRHDVFQKIHAADPISPSTIFALLLCIALVITNWDWLQHRKLQSDSQHRYQHRWLPDVYDSFVFLALGITACIVWFLNFCSLHPAVNHNLNCLWLLPTHLIAAVLLWFSRTARICRIYFGITFALVIVYVVLDWIISQYCPPEFLSLLTIVLLRSCARFFFKR